MKPQKYRPSKGAQFNRKQAQALGETLERIGGFNTKPEQLVEAARPKSSPVHSLFEWDNSTAAEKYRTAQARSFINHLEVVIVTDSGQRNTKAFHNVVVQVGEKQERGYCSVEVISENEDLNAQVIRKALSELKYWQQKYKEFKSYPELKNVFRAIDKAGKKRRKVVAA